MKIRIFTTACIALLTSQIHAAAVSLDWDVAVMQYPSNYTFTDIDYGVGTINVTYDTTLISNITPREVDFYDTSGGFGDGSSVQTAALTGTPEVSTLVMSEAVTDFEITIYDIDNDDIVTVEAFNGTTDITNTITFTIISGSPTFTQASNVFTGDGTNSGGNSTAGSLDVEIAGPVTELRVTGEADNVTTYALSDFNFEAPDPPGTTGSCVQDELDWSVESYTAGTSTQTFTVTDPGVGFNDVDFTFTWSGNTADFVTGNPQENTGFTNAGGLQAADPKIGLLHDPDPNNDPDNVVTLDITFTENGTGTPYPLADARFSLYDLDSFPQAGGGTPDFIDQVIITGSYNGTTVDPVFEMESDGSTIGFVGNQMNGHDFDDSSDDSPRSTVNIYFPSEIDSLEIEYSDSSNFNGDRQILFSTFGFCRPSTHNLPVTLAALSSSKTGNTVDVNWQSASETMHAGYEIELFSSKDTKAAVLANQFIPSAQSWTAEPQNYSLSIDLDHGNQHADHVILHSIDISGEEQSFGPFPIGETVGSEIEPRRTPWQSIQDEVSDKLASTEWSVSGLRRMESRLKSTASSAALLASVSEDGIYRLTHAAMLSAGLDLSGKQAVQIAVSFRSKAVSRHVNIADESTGFSPGDWIDFLGHAPTGSDALYLDAYQYVVSTDSTLVADAPMTESVADGETARFYRHSVSAGEDRHYSFGIPGDDPWYDSQLLSFGSPAQASYDVRVDHLAPGEMFELSLDLVGVTSFDAANDHHILARMNSSGVNLLDSRSDGLNNWQVSTPFTGSDIHNGINTIHLTAPGDTGTLFDLIYVDEVTLHYPRQFVAQGDRLEFNSAADRFEITGFENGQVVAYAIDGLTMSRLDVSVEKHGPDYSASLGRPLAASNSSTRYIVSSQESLRIPVLSPHLDDRLKALDSSTRMLIIAHPAFIGDALTDYAALRSSQGFSNQIINVFDIYSSYSQGMALPSAIRQYLTETAARTDLQYVLLVGGDSYDYRDFTGMGSLSFIPTAYTLTNELISFTPSDALIADLDGDEVQDLAIGRWPVRTQAELLNTISKTIEFEQSGLSSRNTALMVTGRTQPDEPSFTEQADRIAALFTSHESTDWTVAERVYLDELLGENVTIEGLRVAQDTLVDAINAGATTTIFAGHGAPTQWTFDGLLTAETASRFTNSDLPTLVMPLTCYTTYWVDPHVDTLSHYLINNPDGGAVAIHGAVTLSDYFDNETLSGRIIDHMLNDGETLGMAIVMAKQSLAAEFGDRYRTVLINWALLGDPTLGYH